MPILLKKDSIRLFEASVNSLNLALIGLSLPLRSEPRDKESLYASEIGLVGASAEQAINACMSQIYGLKGLLTPDKKFKSASQIFDEFSSLLKATAPVSNFLIQGVSDGEKHFKDLLSKTSKFRILAKSRAGGLHAGYGPSRDIVLALAKDVSDFLILLAQSTRIKPYLSYIPQPHDIVKDRATLVDDLANKVNASSDLHNKAVLISSAFLILPEIDEVQPEWIDAFERISISPTSNDVVLLLDALNKATPSTFIRAGSEGEALPVRVDTKNPNAFSISPQFLRREFNQINDQWYADIGNANGRVKNGILDLPPQDFILDIFGLGLENLNILESESGLPAQQTWPFIATSLSVNGTVYPYWFLIKRTENLKELLAFMKKAEKIGTGYLRRNIGELYEGIESMINQSPLKSEDSTLMIEIFNLLKNIDEKRAKLSDFHTYNQVNDEPETLEIVKSVIDEDISFSEAIIQVCNLDTETSRKIYWVRTLAECCNEEEDIPGLLYALKIDELNVAKTSIRKSLRVIDFLLHGPDCI